MGLRTRKDRYNTYTKEYIYECYILEGKSEEEAEKLSEALYIECRRLCAKEGRFWRKILLFEINGYEEPGGQDEDYD
jgi:hypothetical protein